MALLRQSVLLFQLLLLAASLLLLQKQPVAQALPTQMLLPALAAAKPVIGVTLPAECQAPIYNTCTFYESCLDAVQPCGASGYALGYGSKYCGKFADPSNIAKFSPRGQEWLINVRTCLQLELVPKVAVGSPLWTCSEIKSYAYGTHPKCYVKPKEGADGVCDLPPTDWEALLSIISFSDLFNVRGIPQISQTGLSCLWHWLRVRRELDGGLRALPVGSIDLVGAMDA